MIVFLDSNVVIYYIKCDPYWGPKVEARLRKIAADRTCWLPVMLFD